MSIIEPDRDLFGEPIVRAIPIARDKLSSALKERLRGISADRLISLFYSELDALLDFSRLCEGGRGSDKISLIFNPHRLDTPANGGISVVKALESESFIDGLARAICFYETGGGGKGNARDLLYQALHLGVNGVQYVNEFHPAIARKLYQGFNAVKILDPCAGWGGRMIGAAAIGAFYHGFEPSTKTHAGLLSLGAFLKSFRTGFDFKLEAVPFEDATLTGEYDIAFTSPPYFDTEFYADESTQAAIRWPSFPAFVDGFYIPMARKAAEHSRNGLVLNIGSRKYPMRKVLENVFQEKIKPLTWCGFGEGGLRSLDQEGEVFVHIQNRVTP